MRIYIAGPYSSPNIIQGLRNIREGNKVAAKLLTMGYSPFSPFLDHIFSFYEDISVEQYYKYSLDFLEVCDAMLILPNSENSKGVQQEVVFATKKGIPIYYSIKDLPK